MRIPARTLRRRGLAVLGAAGILATYVGVYTPASADGVAFGNQAFSGSAIGATIHADGLTSGATRVANADIALGSSAVNSKGLTAAANNENGRVISPALGTSKFSYGRGSGVEVGLAQGPPQDGQIILAGKSEGSAPCSPASASCVPPNWHDSQQVGPVNAGPVVYASAAQGTSDAKWNTDTCVLGDQISRGIGYAADAQLLETGSGSAPDLNAPLLTTDATAGRRDVSQTVSSETLVQNSKGTFGLASSVEETIAPVTLFRGTPNEVTIEVLGEWRLTVTASGVPGESKIRYAPDKTATGESVTATTPVLRIVQPNASTPVTKILDTQDLFGTSGLDQINIPGAADIAVGEDPRAIGGDASTKPSLAADGTSGSAAVDVVRVKLLDGSLGDIRIGHMEAKATVPAGGINCPIPVSKSNAGATDTSAPSALDSGNNFVVKITIKNEFACPLENVSLIDDNKTIAGNTTFELAGDNPQNDPKPGTNGVTFTKHSTTSSTASYPNLGTLAVGATKVITVVTHVTGGGAGTIQDIATAKGTLHCGPSSAIGEASLNLTGTAVLSRLTAKVLARTGMNEDLALLVGMVASAAVAVRRFAKTRRATA